MPFRIVYHAVLFPRRTSHITLNIKTTVLFQVIFASALPEIYEHVTTGGKYSGRYKCEKGKKYVCKAQCFIISILISAASEL